MSLIVSLKFSEKSATATSMQFKPVKCTDACDWLTPLTYSSIIITLSNGMLPSKAVAAKSPRCTERKYRELRLDWTDEDGWVTAAEIKMRACKTHYSVLKLVEGLHYSCELNCLARNSMGWGERWWGGGERERERQTDKQRGRERRRERDRKRDGERDGYRDRESKNKIWLFRRSCVSLLDNCFDNVSLDWKV